MSCYSWFMDFLFGCTKSASGLNSSLSALNALVIVSDWHSGSVSSFNLFGILGRNRQLCFIHYCSFVLLFLHCHAFTSISGPKQHPHLIVTTEKCLQTQPNVPPGGRGGTPWLRTMLEVVLPCSCSRYKVRSGRNGSQWSR